MFLQITPATTAALAILRDANANEHQRQQVFDDFYRSYYIQSLKMAQIHLRKEGTDDDYDTESIVQDAWVLLCHKIRNGENIEQAAGLLCEIIKKSIWNAWRKNASRKTILNDLFDETTIKAMRKDEANETEAYASLLHKISLLPKQCCNMFNYLTVGYSIPEMYDELVKERQANTPIDASTPQNIEKWRKTMYVQLSNCRNTLSKLL